MAKRVYLPKSMPRRVAKYVLKKTGLLPLAKRVLGRPQTKPKTPSYANIREVLSYMNAMLVRAPLPVTPVVIYFEGNMTRWYQVEMWFDILQKLNSEVPVSFVIRNQSVFRKIVNETEFPVYLCTTIDDVMNIYDNNDIKCILYVNHAAKNFQSLINKNAFHIHINHGESDKLSTITNQATAYDFVYVVGDAAVNRYAANLLRRDMSRFVKIGRPQLEHVTPIDQELITFPQIGDGEKKVVLYAPTWEGTHHSMNYSSIPEFGVELIKELLADPKFQVIYKPHPNTGSREEATSNAHKNCAG